jgi:hypothetical protein
MNLSFSLLNAYTSKAHITIENVIINKIRKKTVPTQTGELTANPTIVTAVGHSIIIYLLSL